jgi:PAS domain S-box-containing protein
MRFKVGKKFFVVLAAAIFLGGIFVANPSLAEPLEKVSIKLKWFHQFQFAGYYAAKEKGFYAEEGLDVNLIERNPKTDPVDDVVAGEAEYGITDAGLLLLRLQGKPVVMMAQIFQYSPLVFVSLRESGIRTPTDLLGKRVMTDDLGFSDASLKATVLKTLGHLDKVEWVTHTYRMEDLVEKRVDAMLAYSTNEPFWYKEQGIDVITIDPRDYGIDFYGDNIFTTETEIKLHPDRVEKMRRASLKGWKYALEHKDEIIDLIMRKYNTQKWTREHLQFEAEQTEKIINPRFFEIGHFEPSRYQKIAGIYTELSIADRFTVDSGFYYSATEKRVVLTPEEEKWITNNTVKVGVEQWAPIVFSDLAGNVQGLAGGFLDKVAKSTGLKFEIISDEWDPLLQGLKNKTIDLLPATYYTDERATYGLYTDPYFFMREFVYVKDGNTKVKSINDLADQRIAVVKGYGTIPKIRAKYPNATIVETKDLLTSIDAVLNGDVAALMEAQMAVEQTIKTNSIIGLKGISQNVFKASPVHFFSRNDEPLLQSILQKGLNAISEEERREEMKKWISSAETEREKLRLTPAEQSWLSRHESIRLGIDKSWPPFEFIDDDGKYAGISSSYVETVSKRLEVVMEPLRGLTWTDVINKVKSGELDVLPAVARTPDREDYLNFTTPYINIPMIIATSKDGFHVSEINDLKGKSVGVVKGYASTEMLRSDYPDLNLVEMLDVATLLQALSAGEIDAVFENLWVISYEKDRLGLDNIKVAAPTKYNIDLSMGVRKDWPELVPILDKALASIGPRERTSIKNAWLAVEVKFGADMKTILLWVLPVGFGLALVITVIVISNRRMSREITERKLAEKALADNQTLFKTLIDNMPAVVFLKGTDEKFKLVNRRYEEMYDLKLEDIQGKSLHDIYPKHMADLFSQFDRETLDAMGKLEREHTVGEGESAKVLQAVMFPVFGDDGEMTSFGGIELDITERKKAEEERKRQQDALRRSEQRFRNILENSPVAVAISLDDNTSEDGLIQFANPKFLEMFGFKESDIGQIRTESFVPKGESRDEHQAALDEGARVHSKEQIVLGSDGNDLWTLMTISPIEYQGRKAALIWFYDISERKQDEEKLKDAFNIISSSIDYASRIQRSILPDDGLLSAILSDHFVLWEPRDVVGGDVYWHGAWGDGCIIILGDCTGHGVPGAFMTIIAVTALERAMSEIEGGDVGRLISRAHQYIQTTLSQHYEGGDSDDGIELGACYFVPEEPQMTFAGARFELLINQGWEIETIKGTKKGMGYRGIPYTQEYDEISVELKPGQSFYMTSDGMIDQIGGEKKRMFGKKRFRKLLLDIQDKPMPDQKHALHNALVEYQADEKRRDDVSLIGFKF